MITKKILFPCLSLGLGLTTFNLAIADQSPRYVPQIIKCRGSVCETYYDRRNFTLSPPSSTAGDATYTFAQATTSGSLTYYYVGSSYKTPFPVALAAIPGGGPNQLQPYTQGSKWANGECGTYPKGQPPTITAQDCPYTNAPLVKPPVPVPSPGTAALTLDVINRTPFSLHMHLSDRNKTATNFKQAEISADNRVFSAVTMYADASGSYNSEFFIGIGPESSQESGLPLVAVFGKPGVVGFGYSIQPACKVPVSTAAGQTALVNISGTGPVPAGSNGGYILFCVNGAPGCAACD